MLMSVILIAAVPGSQFTARLTLTCADSVQICDKVAQLTLPIALPHGAGQASMLQKTIPLEMHLSEDEKDFFGRFKSDCRGEVSVCTKS